MGLSGCFSHFVYLISKFWSQIHLLGCHPKLLLKNALNGTLLRTVTLPSRKSKPKFSLHLWDKTLALWAGTRCPGCSHWFTYSWFSCFILPFFFFFHILKEPCNQVAAFRNWDGGKEDIHSLVYSDITATPLVNWPVYSHAWQSVTPLFLIREYVFELAYYGKILTSCAFGWLKQTGLEIPCNSTYEFGGSFCICPCSKSFSITDRNIYWK